MRIGLSISIKDEKFMRYSSEIVRVDRSIEINEDEYRDVALSISLDNSVVLSK